MSELSVTQREKLMTDLRVVVSDAEALLKLTASEVGDSAIGLRDRLQERLGEARQSIADLQIEARDKAMRLTRAADDYAHEHPWHAMGSGAVIGAAVGFIFGMLLSRSDDY